MTASTAPWSYQLSSNPLTITINALSYLDRGATGAAIVSAVACAVYRLRPTFTPAHRRLLAVAALWFIAGLAITVRLPVRSDLYALFPSVGAVLACAVVIDAARSNARSHSRDPMMAAVLATMLLLVPVYRGRERTIHGAGAVVGGDSGQAVRGA